MSAERSPWAGTIGTWFTYVKPRWQTELENLDMYEIEKTGLSREKIFELLEYLHEKGVITDVNDNI